MSPGTSSMASPGQAHPKMEPSSVAATKAPVQLDPDRDPPLGAPGGPPLRAILLWSELLYRSALISPGKHQDSRKQSNSSWHLPAMNLSSREGTKTRTSQQAGLQEPTLIRCTNVPAPTTCKAQGQAQGVQQEANETKSLPCGAHLPVQESLKKQDQNVRKVVKCLGGKRRWGKRRVHKEWRWGW